MIEFVEQMDSKCVRIKHCPTAEMLEEYVTEPPQGLQFTKLRGLIMNVVPSSRYHSTHSGHRSVLKINSRSSPTENDVSISSTSTRLYKKVVVDSEPPMK